MAAILFLPQSVSRITFMRKHHQHRDVSLQVTTCESFIADVVVPRFFLLFQQQYMYMNIQECTNNK